MSLERTWLSQSRARGIAKAWAWARLLKVEHLVRRQMKCGMAAVRRVGCVGRDGAGKVEEEKRRRELQRENIS